MSETIQRACISYPACLSALPSMGNPSTLPASDTVSHKVNSCIFTVKYTFF